MLENLGFGLNVVNDKLGPVNEFNASVDFSTQVSIDDKWNTSFGLKFSYNNLNVNFNLLNIYNPSDPFFNQILKILHFLILELDFLCITKALILESHLQVF